MLPLPRLLTLCYVCAALPLRFMKESSAFATSQSAVRATQNANAPSMHVTNRSKKHVICGETIVQHVILITLCERRPMVRLIDLVVGSLWAVANGCEHAAVARATLGEHDSNLQTSRVKRGPFATHSGNRCVKLQNVSLSCSSVLVASLSIKLHNLGTPLVFRVGCCIR